AAMLIAAIRARQPIGELQIAFARLREEQQARWLVAFAFVAHPHVAAEDRLDALIACGTVKLDQAERVAEIGERERGHRVGCRGADRVVDANGAVDDGELAVQAQMNEAGISRHNGLSVENVARATRNRNQSPRVESRDVALPQQNQMEEREMLEFY